MAKIRFYEDPEFLRRQTVFILLALVLGLASNFVPLAALSVESTNALSSALKLDVIQAEVYGKEIRIGEMSKQIIWYSSPAFYFGVLSVLCLAVLAGYKNRKSQANYSRVVSVLFLVSPAVVYFASKTATSEFSNIPYNFSLAWGIALPILASACLFYASTLILSDFKKIKSAERFW